jgi:hypothetical protein
MAKVHIQLAASSFPQQVDVPEGAERSVEGALHFHPGSAKWITADELAHIRVHEPKLASKLRVIAEEAKEPEAKPEATPAEPATFPRPEDEEKAKPRSRRGKRRTDED